MSDRVPNAEITNLENICISITDGKHGDCKDEEGSGYFFLSAKDIGDGDLRYDDAREITQEDFLDTHKRTRLEPFDILVSNSGTIGRIAIAKNAEITNRTTFQKSVALLKPNKTRVSPHWLFYYLRHARSRLVDAAVGTAQTNLLLRDLRSFQVEVPPLSVQNTVASILRAFDDLIENNLQRIEILERTVRTVFREWFVNYRAPGDVPFSLVNSTIGPVPDTWRLTKLGDIFFELVTGSRPKGGIDPSERDVPSIGAENILGLGRYDYSKEKYVSRSYFEGMKHGHVRDRDVLLYKDGAKIGRKSMFRDGFPHHECCINEHVFILRTNSGCSQDYLYFWLDLPAMTERIQGLNSNAAQPGINQEGVRALPILLPSLKLLEAFNRLAEPPLTQLFNLATKNRVLSRTRDLLQSKMVTGGVDGFGQETGAASV